MTKDLLHGNISQTLKNIFQIIKEIEQQFSVDKIKLSDGTHIWNLLRVILAFFPLKRKEDPKGKKVDLKNGFFLIKESLKPVVLPKNKIDFIGFSGTESRKIKEGYSYDIYIDPLYEILGDNFYVFEWPTPSGYRRKYHEKMYSKHYIPMHIPIFSRTFIDLINYKLFKKKVTIEPQKTLSDIVTFFNKKTNSDKDTVMKHLIDSVTVFYIMKEFLRKILEETQPKIVFIRCGYGRFNMALVQAAREMGICTVELQHGVIAKYHIGYVKETESENFHCVPEYLFTYGNIFTDIVTQGYLFKKKNVVTTGFPYIEEVKNETPSINRDLKKFVGKYDYNILITSQWAVAREVERFVAGLSERIDSETGIVFKPHPRDEKDYSNLNKYGNIYITDKYDSIYGIFKVTDIHSTAYSTSGLEALSFGKPNIFIEARTNIKDFFDIVDNESSYMASSIHEYMEQLEYIKSHYKDISKKAVKKSEKIFSPNALENMDKEIKSLMKK